MGQVEVSGRYFSRSIAKWFLSGFELVKNDVYIKVERNRKRDSKN